VRSERLTYSPINLDTLEALYKKGETVTPASLLSKGVVRAYKGRAPKVKILGTGELTKALVFRGIIASAAAKAVIVKVGGTIA
jgi:large subunit ribosomal protein L15